MTEFQRVLSSVEELERLVEGLADALRRDRSSAAQQEAQLPVFAFHPPPRQEPAVAGEDWLLVGSISAFEGQVSEEQREQFIEVQRRLVALEPSVARMRHKCRARAELEVVRAQIQEKVDIMLGRRSADHGEDLSCDALEVARRLVEAGGDGAHSLKPLLDHASELLRGATYGAKMNEQVLDLVVRFDVTQAVFDTDVVPRLGLAVAAADADLAEKRRDAELEAARAMEEARRRAEEEARRPVLELLAANERAMHERQATEARRREFADRAQSLEAPLSCGAAASKGTMGSARYSLFS